MGDQVTENLQSILSAALGDDYAIERELGGGGMSRVFLATDRKLGRRVVVKVLPAELRSPATAERFRREVSVLASLRHPYIVPLLSGGEAGSLLYYTMPYVEGESLRSRLDRESALPVDDAIRITRQVAEALAYAHGRGVVHRDLKPANILLEAGNALVADFGIARVLDETGAGLTGAGVSVGTIGYMAPEQAAADPATDHRADIYSLGVVAYEMIAGRRPYAGSTREMIVAQAQGRTESLSRVRRGTPPEIDRLIAKALHPDPSQRWESAETIVRELEGAGRGGSLMRSTVKRNLAAAVAAVLLIGAVGGAFAFRGGTGDAAEESASVAVLPFVNMGSAENSYFADGMTEELINALAAVPGLRVPARTSSFVFKDQRVDLRDAAARLGVSHVLEGSVRRDADRLRITAQLIKADDGYHVWSHAFDADARDVFRVQDSISREIVRALLPRLGTQQLTLVQQGTRNPEAYAHYLQGLQAFNRRVGDAIPNALAHYRAAIELDPSFAAAHAGLSTAYGAWRGYVVTEMPGANDSSLAAAQRALALDPRSAEAHTAYAAALSRADRPDAAQAAIRTALTLNPQYALAHQWYAYHLRARGLTDSAVAHAEIAHRLDPLSPSAAGGLAQMYLSARRFADAARQYDANIASDPTNPQAYLTAGTFRMATGEYDLAVRLLEQAARHFQRPSLATEAQLAYAYARLGRADASRQAAARARAALARSSPGARDRSVFFWVLEAEGRRAEALKWIEQHHDPGYPTTFPWNHPAYDAFRNDPGFTELATRLPAF